GFQAVVYSEEQPQAENYLPFKRLLTEKEIKAKINTASSGKEKMGALLSEFLRLPLIRFLISNWPLGIGEKSVTKLASQNLPSQSPRVSSSSVSKESRLADVNNRFGAQRSSSAVATGTLAHQPSVYSLGLFVADMIYTQNSSQELKDEFLGIKRVQGDNAMIFVPAKWISQSLEALGRQKVKVGTNFGGPATATASILGALGDKVVLIAPCGEDKAGKGNIAYLNSLGVDTSLIPRLSNISASNLIRNLEVDKNYAKDYALYLEPLEGFAYSQSEALKRLNKGDIVHLGGMDLVLCSDKQKDKKYKVAVKEMVAVASKAKRKGALVVADFCMSDSRFWKMVPDEFFKNIDVVKPSIAQAIGIYNSRNRKPFELDASNPEQLLRKHKQKLLDIQDFLLKLGFGAVFMTFDTGGTVISSGKNSVLGEVKAQHVPIIPASKFVDGTGCGDAYVAGIIHGILNRWDMQKTAVFATAIGSLIAERIGVALEGKYKGKGKFLPAVNKRIALGVQKGIIKKLKHKSSSAAGEAKTITPCVRSNMPKQVLGVKAGHPIKGGPENKGVWLPFTRSSLPLEAVRERWSVAEVKDAKQNFLHCSLFLSLQGKEFAYIHLKVDGRGISMYSCQGVDFYIAPQMRGMGYGKRLILEGFARAIDEANKRNLNPRWALIYYILGEGEIESDVNGMDKFLRKLGFVDSFEMRRDDALRGLIRDNRACFGEEEGHWVIESGQLYQRYKKYLKTKQKFNLAVLPIRASIGLPRVSSSAENKTTVVSADLERLIKDVAAQLGFDLRADCFADHINTIKVCLAVSLNPPQSPRDDIIEQLPRKMRLAGFKGYSAMLLELREAYAGDFNRYALALNDMNSPAFHLLLDVINTDATMNATSLLRHQFELSRLKPIAEEKIRNQCFPDKDVELSIFVPAISKGHELAGIASVVLEAAQKVMGDDWRKRFKLTLVGADIDTRSLKIARSKLMGNFATEDITTKVSRLEGKIRIANRVNRNLRDMSKVNAQWVSFGKTAPFKIELKAMNALSAEALKYFRQADIVSINYLFMYLSNEGRLRLFSILAQMKAGAVLFTDTTMPYLRTSVRNEQCSSEVLRILENSFVWKKSDIGDHGMVFTRRAAGHTKLPLKSQRNNPRASSSGENREPTAKLQPADGMGRLVVRKSHFGDMVILASPEIRIKVVDYTPQKAMIIASRDNENDRLIFLEKVEDPNDYTNYTEITFNYVKTNISIRFLGVKNHQAVMQLAVPQEFKVIKHSDKGAELSQAEDARKENLLMAKNDVSVHKDMKLSLLDIQTRFGDFRNTKAVFLFMKHLGVSRRIILVIRKDHNGALKTDKPRKIYGNTYIEFAGCTEKGAILNILEYRHPGDTVASSVNSYSSKPEDSLSKKFENLAHSIEKRSNPLKMILKEQGIGIDPACITNTIFRCAGKVNNQGKVIDIFEYLLNVWTLLLGSWEGTLGFLRDRKYKNIKEIKKWETILRGSIVGFERLIKQWANLDKNGLLFKVALGLASLRIEAAREHLESGKTQLSEIVTKEQAMVLADIKRILKTFDKENKKQDFSVLTQAVSQIDRLEDITPIRSFTYRYLFPKGAHLWSARQNIKQAHALYATASSANTTGKPVVLPRVEINYKKPENNEKVSAHYPYKNITVTGNGFRAITVLIGNPAIADEYQPHLGGVIYKEVDKANVNKQINDFIDEVHERAYETDVTCALGNIYFRGAATIIAAAKSRKKQDVLKEWAKALANTKEKDGKGMLGWKYIVTSDYGTKEEEMLIVRDTVYEETFNKYLKQNSNSQLRSFVNKKQWSKINANILWQLGVVLPAAGCPEKNGGIPPFSWRLGAASFVAALTILLWFIRQHPRTFKLFSGKPTIIVDGLRTTGQSLIREIIQKLSGKVRIIGVAESNANGDSGVYGPNIDELDLLDMFHRSQNSRRKRVLDNFYGKCLVVSGREALYQGADILILADRYRNGSLIDIKKIRASIVMEAVPGILQPQQIFGLRNRGIRYIPSLWLNWGILFAAREEVLHRMVERERAHIHNVRAHVLSGIMGLAMAVMLEVLERVYLKDSKTGSSWKTGRELAEAIRTKEQQLWEKFGGPEGLKKAIAGKGKKHLPLIPVLEILHGGIEQGRNWELAAFTSIAEKSRQQAIYTKGSPKRCCNELMSKDPVRRILGAFHCTRLAPKEAIPYLLMYLGQVESGDPFLRERCAHALGFIHSKKQISLVEKREIERGLVLALSDPYEGVREWATWALDRDDINVEERYRELADTLSLAQTDLQSIMHHPENRREHIEVHHSAVATIYRQMAAIRLYQGNRSEALAHARSAKKEYRLARAQRGPAALVSRLNLAQIYRACGDVRSSIRQCLHLVNPALFATIVYGYGRQKGASANTTAQEFYSAYRRKALETILDMFGLASSERNSDMATRLNRVFIEVNRNLEELIHSNVPLQQQLSVVFEFYRNELARYDDIPYLGPLLLYGTEIFRKKEYKPIQNILRDLLINRRLSRPRKVSTQSLQTQVSPGATVKGKTAETMKLNDAQRKLLQKIFTNLRISNIPIAASSAVSEKGVRDVLVELKTSELKDAGKLKCWLREHALFFDSPTVGDFYLRNFYDNRAWDDPVAVLHNWQNDLDFPIKMLLYKQIQSPPPHAYWTEEAVESFIQYYLHAKTVAQPLIWKSLQEAAWNWFAVIKSLSRRSTPRGNGFKYFIGVLT
ncbi:MAG: PfkB family carbohydrate kinase, partial [Candidatus Omnitrophota bacterium]